MLPNFDSYSPQVAFRRVFNVPLAERDKFLNLAKTHELSLQSDRFVPEEIAAILPTLARKEQTKLLELVEAYEASPQENESVLKEIALMAEAMRSSITVEVTQLFSYIDFCMAMAALSGVEEDLQRSAAA